MESVVTGTRRGRSAAGRATGWIRAAEAGDYVQWAGSHHAVPTGSPEAIAKVQGGIVQSIEPGYVLVARPNDWGHSTSPYRIPTEALTARERPDRPDSPRERKRTRMARTPASVNTVSSLHTVAKRNH